MMQWVKVQGSKTLVGLDVINSINHFFKDLWIQQFLGQFQPMPTPLLKETLKHIHMGKNYSNVPNNKEFHYMHNIINIQLHVNKDPISLALNIKK
jgi:hypothetical protein